MLTEFSLRIVIHRSTERWTHIATIIRRFGVIVTADLDNRGVLDQGCTGSWVIERTKVHLLLLISLYFLVLGRLIAILSDKVTIDHNLETMRSNIDILTKDNPL